MGFIITLLHVAVCLALIIIILLQAGKGAGMGAAFGGSSQTVFGSAGRATFLTKVTIAAAVIFGLTSIGLSFIGSEGDDLMKGYKAEQKSSAGELPIPPPTSGGEGPSTGEATGGADSAVPGSDVQVPDVNQPRLPETTGPSGEGGALSPVEESPGGGGEESVPMAPEVTGEPETGE
jgi:preprotein translocase subunit SecG